MACERGKTATAELLIAKGADVEAKGEVRQGDKGGWRGVERAGEKPIIVTKVVIGVGLVS